jgi:protein-S-isoprenylcysteine O-methyltransferase Ste14
MTAPSEAMRRRRAALGTLLFTLVLPGTAIVLVPYWLSGWRLAGSWALRALGLALILAALPVFWAFLARFVREGLGTPAPIAPTERLVVGGPFARVRNPGYVAVIGLVLGQALLFGSGAVAVYAALLALAFHLFVIGYEEPTLRRTYGAEYEAYCRRVSRWWPRLGRTLLVLAALPFGAGCATTIESQWKEPTARAEDFAFHKVVALAQVDDERSRRAAEEAMAEALTRGPRAEAGAMEALPAYPLVGSSELADAEALRAKLQRVGFDGAVLMRLVSDEDRITYVPGRAETFYGVVVRYEPGYYDVDRIVRVETSIYSVAEGRLLWTGVTKTVDPRDLPDLVDGIARSVRRELEGQGLLP